MFVINVMCIDLKNGIVEDVHGTFVSVHPYHVRNGCDEDKKKRKKKLDSKMQKP
jgi:hypothetical protein